MPVQVKEWEERSAQTMEGMSSLEERESKMKQQLEEMQQALTEKERALAAKQDELHNQLRDLENRQHVVAMVRVRARGGRVGVDGIYIWGYYKYCG